MHLANAIPIIIARPFLDAVADTAMTRMHTCIVRSLVGVEDCAALGHVAFNNRAGGRLISVLKHPVAHLVARATDQAQDWRSVVVVGAFTFLLIGAPARRV